MQRLAVAITEGELARAADLLGERTARGRRLVHERAESGTVPPQAKRDCGKSEHDYRAAVYPQQREERRMVVL